MTSITTSQNNRNQLEGKDQRKYKYYDIQRF